MRSTAPIKDNNRFRYLYKKGKNAADSYLAVYVKKNGEITNRLGLTVSTKIGCAVVRNKVRRRIREAYRLHEGEFLMGYDIVVAARTRAASATYHEVEKSLLALMNRLGVMVPADSGEAE